MTRPLPEEMPDTWSARAYPFLWAAVARCETYGGANSEELAADTGLPAGELDATARRLRDDGFLEISFEGGGSFDVYRATERGLTKVGAWPSADSLLDRLLAALEEQAAEATSEEERGKIRRAIEAVGRVSRDVMVNAAGSALGGTIGGTIG